MSGANDIRGSSGIGDTAGQEQALVIATRSRSRSTPELRESVVGALMALGFVVSRDEVAGKLHPGNVLLEARRVA